jgi:2,3-bisphosphoglycerate-independent phosphoglycerate mutase
MGIFDKLFKFNSKPEIRLSQGKTQPVVLLILDGWGVAPPSPGNPISLAKTPNMTKLQTIYPHGELVASGESVGLPANEVGNTEVGHLNLGAGRTVLQDLKKISKAIKDGDFFMNKAFREAAEHSIKNNSKLHIMGLVSSGEVHSSVSHLYSLLEFCKKSNLKEVYLHLFTDGRDAPPNEGIEIIKKIEEYIKLNNIGVIATVMGRYFAMDRDRRWDRIQLAYEAIVNGRGRTALSATEALKASYLAGKTDEFVEPTVIVNSQGVPVSKVSDNDSVIFFNFRIDRPRELTMAMTVPDFTKANISWEFDPYATKYGMTHMAAAKSSAQVQASEPFARGRLPANLYFVTMTQYQKNLPVTAIAFPPETVKNGLPEVLASLNIPQMHMAESEKERFVTYYFDGLKEEKNPLEDTLIVPSPKVPTYDKKPEMAVADLAYEVKRVLAMDKYKFIVVNFANVDMVAHSGLIPPTIKAVEHVDRAVGEVYEAIMTVGGTLVITADHGNGEELLTYPQGSYFFTTSKGVVNTDHSNFPVPIVFVSKQFEGKVRTITGGTLADVAPTILSIMNIPKPEAMTGRNLLG